MTKFSKGGMVHRKKAVAKEIAKICRKENMKYRIRKLANGYRVDKDWS